MRWIEAQCNGAKAEWDGAFAACQVNVFGLVLARMKRGNLPELDDVEAVIKEFVQVHEPEALGGSPSLKDKGTLRPPSRRRSEN